MSKPMSLRNFRNAQEWLMHTQGKWHLAGVGGCLASFIQANVMKVKGSRRIPSPVCSRCLKVYKRRLILECKLNSAKARRQRAKSHR